MSNHFIHPYMPNSVPEIEGEMLREIGVGDVSEIYRSVIPEDLLFQGEMDLPDPIPSEQALKRHMNGLLAQNTSTAEALSFLGAGCYQRYIPAVCDEIANRSEFLTAYCGDTYSDHGKMQAIFEYASMMAELLELDVVSYPTYDAGQAVSSSFRMAFRLRPDRKEILIPAHMSPEIRSQAEAYCAPFGTLVPVADPGGILDLEDLKAKLSENTAAVFLENPSFLGVFQPKAREVMDLAHQAGALGIVMPEVSSLGVMDPPARYGADLTCGDIQPLGIHMQYGSGWSMSCPPISTASARPARRGSTAGAGPSTTATATPPGRRPRSTSAPSAACGPSWPGATWPPWVPRACRNWGRASWPTPPMPSRSWLPCPG